MTIHEEKSSMNTFYFYSAIATTVVSMLTFHSLRSPSTKRLPDRAVQHEFDTAWGAAEDDAERFRTDSMLEIEAYAMTVKAMASRCEQEEFAARPYLQSRLQALREHVDYARAEALKLPSSRGEEEFTPAYSHFHRTLVSLKGAFTEAAEELSNGA
jgi:hypothetical protein